MLSAALLQSPDAQELCFFSLKIPKCLGLGFWAQEVFLLQPLGTYLMSDLTRAVGGDGSFALWALTL